MSKNRKDVNDDVSRGLFVYIATESLRIVHNHRTTYMATESLSTQGLFIIIGPHT